MLIPAFLGRLATAHCAHVCDILELHNLSGRFMRKLIAILCGTALLGLSSVAFAQDKMKSDKPVADKAAAKDSMKMDANNDGMVSQDEFMNYHKAMWAKIKKNDKGMAMMADVSSVYGPMGTVKP